MVNSNNAYKAIVYYLKSKQTLQTFYSSVKAAKKAVKEDSDLQIIIDKHNHCQTRLYTC